MPWIKKNKKKREIEKNRIERQKIYNTPLWKNMRLRYVMEHPTSEISEWEGKVALTEHIHHILSFMDVPKEQREKVAFDYNNLIAVTQEEHSRLHTGDLRGCRTKEEIRNKVERLMIEKLQSDKNN